jgi:hypothetical protein
MVKLEAFSPGEGIGLVRTDGQLRLVRPPYSLQDSPLLSDDTIKDAVMKYGYSVSGAEFPDWQRTIEFLNREAAETRRLLGNPIPDAVATDELFDGAPTEVLETFLDRVEKELIPRRGFDHADSFLLALLKSAVLTRYPEIGRRAARLLTQSREARAEANACNSALVRHDGRFESLQRQMGLERSYRVAEMIKARHCVFHPCA